MKRRISATPASAALRRAGIVFGEHAYDYVEHGGTEVAARALGVDEHAVIKTLVMCDERARPMLVLMHGDRRVSTKRLARALGHKTVSACDAATAARHTGYQFGGTSPFGTRRALSLYVEATVLELPTIYLNGGRRGYLVSIDPADLMRLLEPKPVSCALEE